MLANHLWSFAGNDDRPDISNTFVQPFAAYTWPSAWTASVQTETSYNWKSEQWSVPINVALSKLVMFGKLAVSLQGGVGYWINPPTTARRIFDSDCRRTSSCLDSGECDLVERSGEVIVTQLGAS